MPVLQQFAILRAREWGKQSEQQIDVVSIDASSSAQVSIAPADPFDGMIVHYITFHRFLPLAFKVNVSQAVGVYQHEVILSSDLAEVSFWAYVTEASPLVVKVINRLAFAGFLGATLATINFLKLSEMEQVRDLLAREYGIPKSGLPLAPESERAELPIAPTPGQGRALYGTKNGRGQWL